MFEYKKVYFIGIGGIGMSALARMLKSLGVQISGSDQNESEITKNLQKEGINVFIGQSADNLSEDYDCIVYTLAVGKENPEFIKAKELGIPMFAYAQMLGKVSSDKFTIAISGTHGKTTTTAMTAGVFNFNNRHPHVIVGSVLMEGGTNYLHGDENTLVVEACEYKKSFLNLSPDVLIITNIEADHLDFYKDLQDVQNAFRELINKMKEEGVIICDPKDPNLIPVLQNVKQKIIDYTHFVKDVPQNILGNHNILDGAVSLTVSEVMNLDLSLSIESLKNFHGTWRRFEYKGTTSRGVLVYDDYAHHPTAIRATLTALRENFSDKKITIIFHPHTYSRTKALFNDFAEALQGVHEVILIPIYAAREENTFGISSEQLCEAISKKQNCKFFQDFDKVKEYIKTELKEGDLVMTMGAGDVYKIGEDLLN
jgi:UDP-N-acetylmuramate--alanine ligase